MCCTLYAMCVFGVLYLISTCSLGSHHTTTQIQSAPCWCCAFKTLLASPPDQCLHQASNERSLHSIDATHCIVYKVTLSLSDTHTSHLFSTPHTHTNTKTHTHIFDRNSLQFSPHCLLLLLLLLNRVQRIHVCCVSRMHVCRTPY